ncbi:Hypothetical protein NTJ_09667 [Nesidiocoris tenuis]|uniref:Uncharacterized protein n=1 Tax=Nesidiocoris tenuis TaxID=355587 RepID=A0ABN7AZV3_9HEMI|nr:Hypothetical protein NTJ_09667 [Nesidiocoris tenuis]
MVRQSTTISATSSRPNAGRDPHGGESDRKSSSNGCQHTTRFYWDTCSYMGLIRPWEDRFHQYIPSEIHAA